MGADAGQQAPPGLNDRVGPTAQALGQRRGRLFPHNASIKDNLLKRRKPYILPDNAKCDLICGKPKLKVQSLINPRGRVLNGGDGMPAEFATPSTFAGHTAKPIAYHAINDAP